MFIIQTSVGDGVKQENTGILSLIFYVLYFGSSTECLCEVSTEMHGEVVNCAVILAVHHTVKTPNRAVPTGSSAYSWQSESDAQWKRW